MGTKILQNSPKYILEFKVNFIFHIDDLWTHPVPTVTAVHNDIDASI